MGEGGVPHSVGMENSMDEECMAEDLSMTSQISQGDLSCSADLSQGGSDLSREDLAEHEQGDIAHDLVARGMSPTPRDSLGDQPEDLRWAHHM